jgi:hypothetical protein
MHWRGVADVLNDHVVFEVECIDRMYGNVYVPGLQYAAGLVGYVHKHLGLPVASTARRANISDRFSAGVHRFARGSCVPWVDFARGQCRDDVLQEYLAGFMGAQGVVLTGRAQEKTMVPARRNAATPYAGPTRGPRVSTGMVNHYYFCQPLLLLSTTTTSVNHYYFYCVDQHFGPFFIKVCSYFPYCLNGNRWAQHQAAKAGIGFTPLDNAFAAVDDPAGLQQICDRLGPEHITRCWTSGWRSCPTRSPTRTATPGACRTGYVVPVKPISRRAGRFTRRLPISKSLVSVDRGLGSQRPSLLVVLLDRGVFVVHVQARGDAICDDPGAETSRGAVTPATDQGR